MSAPSAGFTHAENDNGIALAVAVAARKLLRLFGNLRAMRLLDFVRHRDQLEIVVTVHVRQRLTGGVPERHGQIATVHLDDTRATEWTHTRCGARRNHDADGLRV